jgi:hypothetical protein
VFKSKADQAEYIRENFTKVTGKRLSDRHWDIECPHCKVVRGFDVITQNFVQLRHVTNPAENEPILPTVYLFRCPVCSGMMHWIVYSLVSPKITKIAGQTLDPEDLIDHYRVVSLPATGLDEIEELPVDPPQLRNAYRQAVRAMDANAPLAAAPMFRRALQIITRDILGAKPGNLAVELHQLVGKQFNGATITQDFSDVGYIIKEAGNQGAHPDKDIDLLDFTDQDARDLQDIFLNLVSELFVIPEAVKKTRQAFLDRRKITPPNKRES